MAELADVREFAIQVAEAVSSVLGVEVGLIDRAAKVIAGTGQYASRVGKTFPSNSTTDRALRTGRTLLVVNPRQDAVCRQCPERSFCAEYASITSPVAIEGGAVGVLVLVALTDQQRRVFLELGDHLVNFATKISALLATAVRSAQQYQDLYNLTTQFETVLDSVHEGVLTIDLEGKVMWANASAARLLGHSASQLNGTSLAEVFGDSLNLKAMQSVGQPLRQEIRAQTPRGPSFFHATVAPIRHGDRTTGIVVSFRDSSEVAKSVIGDFARKQRRYTFDDLLGSSEVFVQAKKRAMVVSSSNTTVLIRGETGTGKELFARAIHYSSPRANGPLVAVNCGAIPETLLESEMFGYEEGAFTGAKRGGKPGYFELAEGGTLLLDEIGDMPVHLQPKLLRALEEQAIRRVGGTKVIPINVRVIASTHRDLEQMVARGEFRGDLFYRLNVLLLHIPPLRERRGDILILAEQFCARFSQALGKSLNGFTREAEQMLLRYPWPGNVRELENAVAYAAHMETGPRVQLRSLPDRIKNRQQSDSQQSGLVSLAEMERDLIMRALQYYGHSAAGKTEAARHLGIGVATLYRKLKRYELG